MKITDMGAALDPQFERVSDTETVLREFYDKAYAAGVAAERERCAKVCDEITNSMYWLNDRNEISQDCADAIRKGE